MILLQSLKSVAKKGAKAAKGGVSPSIMMLIATVVFLLLIAIGSFIGFQQTLKDKDSDFSKKGTFLYTLCFALLFALLGLLALTDKTYPQPLYWGLCTIFIIAGTIHCWLMYLLHDWAERKSFWPEAFYTLFVGSVGAILFVLVFYFLEKQGYPFHYNLSMVGFFIPFLVVKAFDYWYGVPQRIFKGWKYVHSRRPSLAYSADRLQHVMLVSLVISEETHDNSFPTKVVIKVSPNYNLGEFFHVWVAERNNTRDLKPIKYLDRDPMGNEISWVFYTRSKEKALFKRQSKRYLDPDMTFGDNQIKDTDVIVALRVVGETFTSRSLKSMQKYEQTVSSENRSRGININSGRNSNRHQGNHRDSRPDPKRSGIKINKRNSRRH